VRYEIQPLGPWTEPITENRRSRYTFKATWSDTKALLTYEVDLLGADLIVVQLDVTQQQIRADGALRANVSVGPFPGVRVSFTSHRGPLMFSTDTHEKWEHNVRAVALALQSLRAVDRYGVTKRGEQYTGWTALPQREHTMTREQAIEFIAHWAGIDKAFTADNLDHAYRLAAKRLHPDAGGTGDDMARLNAARDLVAGGAR
jgi:hypothetical protein